jgi:cob(I)alamin adenosyltransferase
MSTKIYTKTGDEGKTSLLGGVRVPKHHLRIETYGTIDELNSFIGMTRDMIPDESKKELLKIIQDRLFVIGAHLASAPEKNKMSIPDLLESDVSLLERSIDQMNENLPELKSFILPGGHPAASWCHLSRCVCRRAERLVSHLMTEEEVHSLVIVYLNRLSDFLFVLARMVLREQNLEEIEWKSGR